MLANYLKISLGRWRRNRHNTTERPHNLPKRFSQIPRIAHLLTSAVLLLLRKSFFVWGSHRGLHSRSIENQSSRWALGFVSALARRARHITNLPQQWTHALLSVLAPVLSALQGFHKHNQCRTKNRHIHRQWTRSPLLSVSAVLVLSSASLLQGFPQQAFQTQTARDSSTTNVSLSDC